MKVLAVRVEIRDRWLPAPTISCWVAIYPEHGTDASRIIDAADAALYDAKRTGRDRVVVSAEVGEIQGF